MNECISVIIPVYNVEKYLRQCIDSVINQTYKNLEIILIDDASPDNCGKICDEYAEKDSRVKVIHKKNGGAASARNEGLKIATGEYLAFVDSDDFLEVEAYERMVAAIEKNDADVVQCAFRDIYKNCTVDRLVQTEEQIYRTADYMCKYITDWTCGLIWDKLFKRKLFDGILYETGHLIDDEFFTYQGVMNANKVAYSPIIVYNYRRRGSSVMNNEKASERILFDRLDYATKRRKNVVERFPELKQAFDYSYLDSLLVWSTDPFLTVAVADEIKRLLKLYVKEGRVCRISLSVAWQLFSTCCTSSEKLVKKRRTEIVTLSNRMCFE